jgi:hypothetical protein
MEVIKIIASIILALLFAVWLLGNKIREKIGVAVLYLSAIAMVVGVITLGILDFVEGKAHFGFIRVIGGVAMFLYIMKQR